jgi:hypothetical protein
MITATSEPFGFFTLDSARAGWYVLWRVFVRVFAAVAALGIVAAVLIPFLGIAGIVLVALPALGLLYWSFRLLPRIASQWAQEHYGRPLERWLWVWWSISWRTWVAAMVAAMILAVPNVVAVSFQTAYKGSALGALGSLVVGLLSLVNFAVSIVAQGWALSRVAHRELGGVDPLTPMWTPSPLEATPVAAAPPAVEHAPAPRPVTRPVAAPSAPAVTRADGKRQCPKCGLYETERGSVIGWYCKVCGWREARR